MKEELSVIAILVFPFILLTYFSGWFISAVFADWAGISILITFGIGAIFAALVTFGLYYLIIVNFL